MIWVKGKRTLSHNLTPKETWCINPHHVFNLFVFSSSSSGIIWQNKIRRRWKDLNIKEMKALEDGYQKHQVEVANNKDAPPKNVKLEHHLEVCVEE